MLVPEFQKQIDSAFDKLNLSDERRAILQPILEQRIEVVKTKSDDVNTAGYKIAITDDAGKSRVDAAGKPVTISQLVEETHKNISDKSIPLVENKDLTPEQLKQIAAGTLGLKPNKSANDKDALSQEEVMEQRPSLEDVASGKTKVGVTE